MPPFSKMFLLGAFLALLTPFTSSGYDSEWPPAPDPTRIGMQPAPGLEMGEIAAALPSEFTTPYPNGTWMAHLHHYFDPAGAGNWGVYPLHYAFGDIEGANDGEQLDIVIHMAEEFVLAGRLDINWQASPAPTMTFTPLWAWKTPLNLAQPPAYDDLHSGARHVLIWDFDNDGTNEVVVEAPAHTTHDNWQALYLLRTNPNPPAPPYATGWSMPPPLILAVSAAENGSNTNTVHMGDQLGLCKVRDTPYAQDIIAHNHTGISWSVWSLINNAGTWNFNKIYFNGYGNPTHINHAYNWRDIDGDGYDEFMWNGVHDFVDKVGGVATPINGPWGIQRWETGHNLPFAEQPPAGWVSYINGGQAYDDHTDMTICADFIPSHPGLEIMTAPQHNWRDWHGGFHGTPNDRAQTVIWDTNGNILREATTGPYQHPQNIMAGNFVKDSDLPGLEVLHCPKSYSPSPQGDDTTAARTQATYAEDADLNMIAVDGCSWATNSPYNGEHPTRSTGPADGARQIDWDGDHISDEILDTATGCTIVWRMGKKGDWLPGPPPAGMPTQQQVTTGGPNGNGSWIENDSLGNPHTLWWQYYQNANGNQRYNWGWNNGGAGRYTCYYQKLAEIWSGWLPATVAFDLGRDYREEIVAVDGGGNPAHIYVRYNKSTLANLNLYASPTTSRDYLIWRMAASYTPFDFTTIGAGSLAPVADFRASVTTGTAPLFVRFHDQSTLTPDSWTWDFGDGTPVASGKDPVHTYTTPGQYTVTLTAGNTYGTDGKVKTNFINVSPRPHTDSRNWSLYE